jgi:hypothetical protein
VPGSRGSSPPPRRTAPTCRERPGQGCITDLRQQFGQAQPDSRNFNFFGRFTGRVGDAEAYAELGLSKSETRARRRAQPRLGAQQQRVLARRLDRLECRGDHARRAHPDNPYFGTAAR